MGQVVNISLKRGNGQCTGKQSRPVKDDSPWADRPWRRQMLMLQQMIEEYSGADALRILSEVSSCRTRPCNI